MFERVENITYDGVGTRTGEAIQYAALNTFTAAEGDRQNISDIAIIITDGVSQDSPEETIDVSYEKDFIIFPHNHSVFCSFE